MGDTFIVWFVKYENIENENRFAVNINTRFQYFVCSLALFSNIVVWCIPDVQYIYIFLILHLYNKMFADDGGDVKIHTTPRVVRIKPICFEIIIITTAIM